ncbi:hypothetical protein, partial [Lysinibacillus xylanilyticus]|uniref:hypothetical protein n=1 Tax=Lysinibacillus xylanilyticus TaxID=582475 RepID=UPI0036DC522B
NRRNDRFTQLFADEGNQYLEIPGLCQYISDLTARARSSNMNVVFLTNDLSVVSKPSMSGFKANIAVYIVGRTEDGDLDLLKGMTGSEILLNQATRIKKNPGQYRHCFAVYNTLNGHPVNAIVRADLPEDVRKAFASRTIKKEAY